MPIVRQWTVFEECLLLIWEIFEPIEELQEGLVATAEEWAEYETISHPQKRLEWLTGRRAMQSIVEASGRIYTGMRKDNFGKPFLNNAVAEISLTHTARFVVVALHPSVSIGVDLERVAPKLARVAPKFLSDSETTHAGEQLERLCTYWCAKEALYKLHGTRNLSFKEEILIHSFTDGNDFFTGETFPIHTPLPRQQYRLYRFWVDDFLGVLAV